MDLSMFAALVLVGFVVIISLGMLAGIVFNGLMLCRLLNAFRWMEFQEAQRAHPLMMSDRQGNVSFVNQNRIPITKEEADGAFIPHSDFDAYVREESGQVAKAAGISDEDAAKIILEKIRDQNMSKGNVANV